MQNVICVGIQYGCGRCVNLIIDCLKEGGIRE